MLEESGEIKERVLIDLKPIKKVIQEIVNLNLKVVKLKLKEVRLQQLLLK